PIGPTVADSLAVTQPKLHPLPTDCEAWTVMIAPPPLYWPLPSTVTATLFSVEPSQVRNGPTLLVKKSPGPPATWPEPVVTALPFACERSTCTKSITVGSPFCASQTTCTGTVTNNLFVTVGVPTVMVTVPVAPADDAAKPNIAVANSTVATKTLGRALTLMLVLPLPE